MLGVLHTFYLQDTTMHTTSTVRTLNKTLRQSIRKYDINGPTAPTVAFLTFVGEEVRRSLKSTLTIS